ncbi:MAG: cell wall-binding repeat-containing protein [Acidimicrobiales bacterium]
MTRANRLRAVRRPLSFLLAAGLVAAAGFTTLGSAAPAGASVTTLYASARTGSGSVCSLAQPCTLTTALSGVGPGGTIELVTGGTQGSASTYYSGTFTISTAATSAGSPVTIEPASGVSDPILDGGNSGTVLTIGIGVHADLDGVTVQDGTAMAGGLCLGGHGGGICNNEGTLDVNDSTISGNTSSLGGGIANYQGTLDVNDSTISGNGATAAGGGIANFGLGGSAIDLTTSTVADNTSGTGGGIFDQASVNTADVVSSTISANSAGVNGPALAGSSFTVAADLFTSSCSSPAATDDGYNVGIDTSCFGAVPPATDDASASASLLGGLADNGGPTQTMWPETGNPAIAHITNPTSVIIGASPISLCPTVDQRGVPSVPGASCASGAVQPVVGALVSGTQTLGGLAHFTYTTLGPSGVSVSGTLICTTVDGGTAIGPALPLGSYTIDGSSCSGLSSTPYPVSYIGVNDGFVVSPGAGSPPGGALPPPRQIYGQDAIGTSIAIAQAEFPSAGSASSVVLARSDFFSDALAGGPFAASVGGPLLITEGASSSAAVDPRVAGEIQFVLPKGATVYILGGPLALSPSIDGQLQSMGYVPQRIAGPDEFATAVDIAQAMGNPSVIFEATGLSFYDALSSVPAAIKEGAAILLTDGSAQAPETAAYLAAHRGDTRFAIGGPLAALGADPSAAPIYGQDLYGTSVAVAETFFSKPKTYGVATSGDFPDALGGGVFMGTAPRSGPMLLVPPALPLPAELSSYLATVGPGAQGYVFGGPLAIPPAVVAALQAAQL